MPRLNLFIVIPLVLLMWSSAAAAFRVCDASNSYAYTATTQYAVGEIAFDRENGLASGTETTYNYSNREQEGFSQCHVTYELSGMFEPGSGTLILEAQRTNQSDTCPEELISFEYPSTRQYVWQLEFKEDKTFQVLLADSGEIMASGEWDTGKTTYRTDETCTIF